MRPQDLWLVSLGCLCFQHQCKLLMARTTSGEAKRFPPFQWHTSSKAICTANLLLSVIAKLYYCERKNVNMIALASDCMGESVLFSSETRWTSPPSLNITKWNNRWKSAELQSRLLRQRQLHLRVSSTPHDKTMFEAESSKLPFSVMNHDPCFDLHVTRREGGLQAEH